MEFVRERNNRYDQRAIMVVNQNGEKMGYIPHKQNKLPSRLMDSGMNVYGLVSAVSATSVSTLMFMDVPGKMVRRHFRKYWDVGNHWIIIESISVTRNNIYIEPMSKTVKHIVLHRGFSDDDIWNLRWGHRAMSMDDRWNMVFEDDCIHIASSWTGRCGFTITLGDRKEHDVMVNCDPDLFKHQHDDEVLELVNSLLDSWLEDVYVPVDAMPGTITGNVRINYERDRNLKWAVNSDGTIVVDMSHGIRSMNLE